MKKVAIFASGNGSNAQRLAEHFKGHDKICISLVLCNKPGAYVLERAKILGIPSVLFSRDEFNSGDKVAQVLREQGIDYLVLAGFLWLIPSYLLKSHPDRIINIHPALLPKFGGKGMYGLRVHESVIAAGETTTGITIHLVNEVYDEGRILFQASCPVLEEDTPESLASRVHELEYLHFPAEVERFISGG